MSIEIEDKVENHEKRITTLEISNGRMDERIEGLTSSTNNLKWCVWGFTFLCLLALIYGALGANGFNQVIKAQPQIQSMK